MYKTRHKATEWGKKTMKQPVLLCYNLTGEKMQKIRLAAMRLKIRVRPVEKAEYAQTIAALCGADAATCRALMDAATTDACLDILDAAQLREPVMASLLTAIQTHLDRRAAGAFKVGAVLFSNRNGPLGQTKTADTLLKLWEGA
mgnify:CR=1 FL=1